MDNTEFDKLFNRLKNTKQGAAIDFVKPSVFATLDKWRVFALGSDIKTDTGWVRCQRFLHFHRNPQYDCLANMVAESAIEAVTLQGDKAIIEFKRGNTKYKVQLDLSKLN